MTRGPQVFIWKTTQDENGLNGLLSALPEPDKMQAAKITRSRRQTEFVCGRYLLRKVFSDRFQVNLPEQLLLTNSKPQAESFPPFNLSHSQKTVSFAISDRDDIGLDIETEDEKRDVLKIAETYGNVSEVALLKNLQASEQTTAFYKLWSLKESFAKATGTGLDMNLQKLTFDFEKSQIVETPKNQKCVVFHSKRDKLHISVSVLAEDAITPTVWEVEKTRDGFQYVKLENVHFEKFVVVVPSVAAHH